MGLYHATRPLRLGSLTSGVYADGWMAGAAHFEQFAPLPAGSKRITVSVSRTVWMGGSPTSAVKVRLIARGREVASRRTTIRSGMARTISFPVSRAPFRVDVFVVPTFMPATYGGTDTRQLGAQVAFSLAPHAAP
jgi:hypothetical protein